MSREMKEMKSRSVKQNEQVNTLKNKWDQDAQINFMGGISYRVDPLDTLKMISASFIFGEPQYYRDGDSSQAKVLDGVCAVAKEFTP